MKGVKDLSKLLSSMKPRLIGGRFVFCIIPKGRDSRLKDKAVLVFREKEGTTLILEKKIADENHLAYNEMWAMITLSVHSDLNAVGFLAAITNKLAVEGISVNAVSAYYHDHLFVPYGRAKEAIKLLNEFSTQRF